MSKQLWCFSGFLNEPLFNYLFLLKSTSVIGNDSWRSQKLKKSQLFYFVTFKVVQSCGCCVLVGFFGFGGFFCLCVCVCGVWVCFVFFFPQLESFQNMPSNKGLKWWKMHRANRKEVSCFVWHMNEKHTAQMYLSWKWNKLLRSL